MRKLSVAIAAVLAIMLTPAASWAIGIEAAIGMWQQSPTGTIEYQGDVLDLGDDLGIEDEKRMTGRVKLDMPGFIPNIYLMGTQMNFEGTATSTFDYGGVTFTGDIESELVLDHYDIAFYYGVPFLSTLSADKLNLEAGLNIRAMDFEAKVTEVLSGTVESESLSLVVPMIYVGLQIRPTDKFAFEFEGRGISYSGNSYYDAIARVKLKPLGPVFVAGGYRYQTIKVDEDDTVVDMTFEGPFVEAGFEF